VAVGGVAEMEMEEADAEDAKEWLSSTVPTKAVGIFEYCVDTEVLSSGASATLRSSFACLVGELAREWLLDFRMILCNDCEALPVEAVLPTTVSASKLLLLCMMTQRKGIVRHFVWVGWVCV
jgi:hypothetical protein